MAAKRSSSKSTTRKQRASDEAVSYDEFKTYEGQRYTGMKIGRAHSWNYDSGRWKEKKITPDLWQINYAVTKRRAGRAPEGSGVPVGTEYHWYILAHQNVEKLNANDYTTSLAGLKFKIAHRRADSEKWSATPKTQRKRMIRFLRDVIEDLENAEAEAATPVAEAASAPKKKPGVTSSARKSSAKKRSGAKAGKGARSKTGSAARKSSTPRKSSARKRTASGKRTSTRKTSTVRARRKR
jgi:hypothetical protein